MPLLIVAGLLLRSVARLEHQSLAVDRHHVLAIDFGPAPPSGVPPNVVRGQVLAAVRVLPGVADATFASQTPLGGAMHASSLRVEGAAPRDDAAAVAAFVGPDEEIRASTTTYHARASRVDPAVTLRVE